MTVEVGDTVRFDTIRLSGSRSTTAHRFLRRDPFYDFVRSAPTAPLALRALPHIGPPLLALPSIVPSQLGVSGDHDDGVHRDARGDDCEEDPSGVDDGHGDGFSGDG